MQKKVWQGMLMLTLVLGMVLVFTACTGKDGVDPKSKEPLTETPVVDYDPARTGGLALPLTPEKVTFDWFISERADASVKNNWPIMKALEARTNVSINFQATPGEGFEEKKKILIATSAIPDIASVGLDDAVQYGPEGVFLRLNELIAEHAPNIRQLLENNPDAVMLTHAGDGGMYGLPILGEGSFSFSWMARQDIMEELGIAPPATTDEFYRMLQTMKEAYPESYPLTTRSTTMTDRQSLFIELIKMYTEVQDILGFDPVNQKFAFAIDHPDFIEALLFMHKLFEEELLDPEFSFLNAEQWEQRLLTNKSFVTFDFKGRADQLTTKGVANLASYNMHPIPQFADAGKTPYQTTSPLVYADRTIALSAKINNPEIAVKYLDYLYSEEGTDFTELGILGETYEIVDGKPRLLESLNSEGDFIGKARRNYGMVYDGIRINATKFGPASMNLRSEKYRIVDEMYADVLLPPANVFVKTEADIEKEKELLPNLQKFIDQKLTEFVMGRIAINEQTVQDFLNQCDLLGAAELTAMYNERYTAALNKK